MIKNDSIFACYHRLLLLHVPGASNYEYLRTVDNIQLQPVTVHSQAPTTSDISAFAITINKSQEQTNDHVGICLIEPVFSHGQLYCLNF
jgi:hypothetical protein